MNPEDMNEIALELRRIWVQEAKFLPPETTLADVMRLWASAPMWLKSRYGGNADAPLDPDDPMNDSVYPIGEDQ